MPELPEVEHQARALRRFLRGAVIERAEADATIVLGGETTPASFAAALEGRALESVERIGKHLLLRLDGGVGLRSHLGMSGKWVRRAAEDPTPRHSRARLFLGGGVVLHYVDVRMLGRIEIVAGDDLDKGLDLGPDPLRDGLDARTLASRIGGSSRAIKALLLDQSVVAGLGNIQATEALFRARLHPSRPSSSLSRDELAALVEGIHASIAHTLAAHDRDEEIVYLSERTSAPNPFLVYGRVGEPCPRCGSPIASMTIAGRTSAFCPSCQRPTRSAPRRGRG